MNEIGLLGKIIKAITATCDLNSASNSVHTIRQYKYAIVIIYIFDFNQ